MLTDLAALCFGCFCTYVPRLLLFYVVTPSSFSTSPSGSCSCWTLQWIHKLKTKEEGKNIQKMCFNSCRLLTVHYCLFFLYSFLVFLFTSLFVFFKKFFGIFFWAHIRRWNFILVSERTSVRVFKIIIFVFLLGFLQKTSLEKQK